MGMHRHVHMHACACIHTTYVCILANRTIESILGISAIPTSGLFHLSSRDSRIGLPVDTACGCAVGGWVYTNGPVRPARGTHAVRVPLHDTSRGGNVYDVSCTSTYEYCFRNS